MAKGKRQMRKAVKSSKALFINDLHVPHHDAVAVDLVLDFASWFKPDTVFVNGDLLDFYAISAYDKDPARLLSLQEELDAGKALLKSLRDAVGPRTRVHFLEGNHEYRLTRYLWRHPEIATLQTLQLPALLGLADMDIVHHDYHQSVEWYGMVVEHGDRVRQASAGTAAAMLQSRGVCGISGHTHRLGVHYKTDRGGMKAWWENGCLCNLRPEYLIGHPNWQQGFSVGFGQEGDNRFILHQIPIIRHRIWWEGNLWSA